MIYAPLFFNSLTPFFSKVHSFSNSSNFNMLFIRNLNICSFTPFLCHASTKENTCSFNPFANNVFIISFTTGSVIYRVSFLENTILCFEPRISLMISSNSFGMFVINVADRVWIAGLCILKIFAKRFFSSSALIFLHK
jgi:hypothetical protein